MTLTLTLPTNAKTTIQMGQPVDFDDILYSTFTDETIQINIAEKLHIKPEAIFHYLLKIIGEEIQTGDIIAQKKGTLFSQKVTSDYSGILKEIDHHAGTIRVTATTEEQKDVLANFHGDIEQIEENKIKISIKNGTLIEVRDVQKDGMGKLFNFADESFYFSATEEDLANKIILIKEIKPHIQAKCEALGCNGFMYLKGTTVGDCVAARIKNEAEYIQIASSKKENCIFTLADMKAIVYD